MEQWEYKVVYLIFNRASSGMRRMNEMGAEGWEAFAVLRNSDADALVFYKRRAALGLADGPQAEAKEER